jgi:lipopolysaccharide biosynthesis glycosyltransferase
MINVFIGYDSKEKIAYHILSESILRHSSVPVSFTPIYLPNIQDSFNRPRNSLSSTEFSFSRFIVPYLMNYDGWALFLDCDMLFKSDIKELWDLRNDDYAVMCCQHNYTPKSYIHNASGLELHQFKWLEDNQVGGLPLEWNWLAGEYPYNPNAKNIHFTEGGCYFEKYEDCDYSSDWFNIYTNTVKIQL